MLAADKLLLQSRIRQNAIQLKEKEFQLHNANFGTVGTQAAVLAGFTMTAFAEMTIPPNSSRILCFVYYTMVTVSLCANLFCVGETTTLSVFGTSLSLRGPDGSMIRAVDGMYEERYQIFQTFAVGIFSLFGAMAFGSLLTLQIETALSTSFILAFGAYRLYDNSWRLVKKFGFDESDSISFDDILGMDMSVPKQTLNRARQATSRMFRGGNQQQGEDDDIEAALLGVGGGTAHSHMLDPGMGSKGRGGHM